MEFIAKQSLSHIDGISDLLSHRNSTPRRSWLRRIGAVLAALSRTVAGAFHLPNGRESMLRMTEHQLRDIGLHRVESTLGVHIVPLGDAER